MGIEKKPVDEWIIEPLSRFINKSTTSGLVLFFSAFAALILANSPWAEAYHHIWAHKFSIGYDNHIISKDLHHWINDGLMAVFFFVVGLELKREIVAGELRDPKAAILPIAAAIGGMVVPAAIYAIFNHDGPTAGGWGIPMATDIAFALGVLYLLGNKVPLSLKIFLTVLAIADDLGAVLVIAFFYTSQIDFTSLIVGGIFLVILLGSNALGVRNPVFYGIMGIGGLWLAFLLSGVHATIAAVLAAFTIPANVKIDEQYFNKRLSVLLEKFKLAKPNNVPTVSEEQFHLLQEIRNTAKYALTPLQRLEHGLHPIVAFIIMPVFAFSNAGVTFTGGVMNQLFSPVSVGVFLGLLVGKFLGVVGTSVLLTKMGWCSLPEGMKGRHMVAAGFLAAIGFTMSLFIAGLAFKDPVYVDQAKLGILAASLLAGVVAFILLRAGPDASDQAAESH